MDEGKLEWGSDNLDTIFAQRKNLASPAFLQMLRDVIRFGREAPKVPNALSIKPALLPACSLRC
jgi:predicted NAD/FAD-binding protein